MNYFYNYSRFKNIAKIITDKVQLIRNHTGIAESESFQWVTFTYEV